MYSVSFVLGLQFHFVLLLLVSDEHDEETNGRPSLIVGTRHRHGSAPLGDPYFSSFEELFYWPSPIWNKKWIF